MRSLLGASRRSRRVRGCCWCSWGRGGLRERVWRCVGVSVATVRLDEAQLVELARLVAAELVASDAVEPRAGEEAALVDARELARALGVSRAWIYRNAAALGGRRLGDGTRGRLRFSIDEARDATARLASRALGQPRCRCRSQVWGPRWWPAASFAQSFARSELDPGRATEDGGLLPPVSSCDACACSPPAAGRCAGRLEPTTSLATRQPHAEVLPAGAGPHRSATAALHEDYWLSSPIGLAAFSDLFVPNGVGGAC